MKIVLGYVYKRIEDKGYNFKKDPAAYVKIMYIIIGSIVRKYDKINENFHTYVEGKKKSIEDKLDFFVKYVLENIAIFYSNFINVANRVENHSHTVSVNDVVGFKRHNHDKRYSKINHEHSEYSKKRHKHSIKDITNLQNELNKYSLTTHTYSFGINDITNLQNELNKYALTSHTHNYGINDIINLQNELNNRSLTTHTHSNFL